MPRLPHTCVIPTASQVAARSDANCDSPFNTTITAGGPQLCVPGNHATADSLVCNGASWRGERPPHYAATDERTAVTGALAMGDAGPGAAAREEAQLAPAEGLVEDAASSLRQEVGGSVASVMT